MMWKRYAALARKLLAVIVICWSSKGVPNGVETLIGAVARGVPCEASLVLADSIDPQFILNTRDGEPPPAIGYLENILQDLSAKRAQGGNWNQDFRLSEPPNYPFLVSEHPEGAPLTEEQILMVGHRLNDTLNFFKRHRVNRGLRDGVVIQVKNTNFYDVISKAHRYLKTSQDRAVERHMKNRVISTAAVTILSLLVTGAAHNLLPSYWAIPLTSLAVGGATWLAIRHNFRKGEDTQFSAFLRLCETIALRGRRDNFAHYASEEELVVGPSVGNDGKYYIENPNWVGVPPSGRIIWGQQPQTMRIKLDIHMRKHNDQAVMTIFIREDRNYSPAFTSQAH